MSQRSPTQWPSWYTTPRSDRDTVVKNPPVHFCSRSYEQQISFIGWDLPGYDVTHHVGEQRRGSVGISWLTGNNQDTGMVRLVPNTWCRNGSGLRLDSHASSSRRGILPRILTTPPALSIILNNQIFILLCGNKTNLLRLSDSGPCDPTFAQLTWRPLRCRNKRCRHILQCLRLELT